MAGNKSMRVTGSKSKWKLARNLNGYRYLFFFLRGVGLGGNWRVISTVTVIFYYISTVRCAQYRPIQSNVNYSTCSG